MGKEAELLIDGRGSAKHSSIEDIKSGILEKI